MTGKLLEEIKQDLKNGLTEKNHPLRYCTLATVGLDRVARLRTVVIRNMTDDFVFSIYTDKRSKKIIHIKENKMVSMLFYDPGKLMQIKIEGTAVINKNHEVLKALWKKVDAASQKDYTTALPPGSTVKDPELVEFLRDEDYFCLLEIHPFKIEYLRLKRPHHLRVRYSYKEGSWKGEFLVP